MLENPKSLDDYLLEVPNQTILEQLERIGLIPLPFFNLLYELIDLVKQGHPSQAIGRLNKVEVFQAGLRLYILHCVRDRLRDPLAVAVGWTTDDPEYQKQQAALFVIDKEYDDVAKRFPPDLFPNDPQNSISDRARQEVASNDMISQVIGSILQKAIKEGEEKAKLEEEIELRVRQSERERLQAETSEIVQATLAAFEKPKRNPEFTTNRQVIALGYMLNQLGVPNIDKQTQADFIEFLTSKNNKEIYDRVRELDQTVFNLGGRDAEYVRDWFRRLGWNELANQIPDIATVRREDL